ncbi:MAG TPA: alpha/beta fold hydrolase [Thermoguttaceae bacterium]|nr:alpha/beta fold hydrolase [Thermoguttaceae bacterium]
MTKPAISTPGLLVAVVLLCTASIRQDLAAGQIDVENSQTDIRVRHDDDAFITTISIPAADGRVAWADVLRGLARARGFDDSALLGVLPQGRIELGGTRGRLFRAGLNLALSPHLRFDVAAAETPGDPPWLVITLDRAALLASQRKFEVSLRTAFLPRPSGGDRPYGLDLDDDWEKAPVEKDLVVLVHGLNSSPEQVAGLLAAARREGLPCGTFRFPNDRAVADSAKLLADELGRFAREHPGRGVSLLTHSMGGLIARAVIEDPRSDPGNVRRLIMVAPPNQGSALARFAFALDLWEYLAAEGQRNEVSRFYALIEDGLSEAAVDLRPGSLLLRTLNARPRNPRVRYTIFLGSEAPLAEKDLAVLKQKIAAAGKRNRWVRLLGPNAHEWLDDLDEVIDGKGDGAVSIRRGRLEGVEDTVVLRFGHLGVLQWPGQGDMRKVHDGVLQRLKGS